MMNSKAFDVQEDIRKEFAKGGTGSYPIYFEGDDGLIYHYDSVKTNEKAIIVKLRRV